MKKPINPYRLLRSACVASSTELKNSYKRLCKRYHPDKLGSVSIRTRALKEEHFKLVQLAYEVLSDVEKRKLYDEFGLGFEASDPAAALTQRALGNLKQLFTNILAQVPAAELEYTDLVEKMREHLQKQLPQVRAELADMESKSRDEEKILKTVLKRLKQRKKTVPNVLQEALQETLASLPGRIAQQEEHLRVGERMLELLEEFSYTTKARPVPTCSATSFSGVTFFTTTGGF